MFQGWAMCGYKAVPSPLPASQHSLNIYLESSGRAYWDQECTGMEMAKQTTPKYTSVIDHETMTFYQIKTGTLISLILWLEVVSQIWGLDDFF